MQRSRPFRAVVIDGLESFELSQYYPFHHHVAVEKDTDFLIYFTDSELRRKGRMRLGQKKRRRALERHFGRPDPQAVRKDVAELLSVSLPADAHATLYSDDRDERGDRRLFWVRHRDHGQSDDSPSPRLSS